MEDLKDRDMMMITMTCLEEIEGQGGVRNREVIRGLKDLDMVMMVMREEGHRMQVQGEVLSRPRGILELRDLCMKMRAGCLEGAEEAILCMDQEEGEVLHH